MEFVEHLRALDREGQLLVAAAEDAGLDAPIPSCPAWKVRDLLAHVGHVHRWAGEYVASGTEEMVDELSEAQIKAAAPPDEELLDWVADGHQWLLETLAGAPKDLSCWTFLPAPSPLAFWARRQAHETAIHRVDAELAAADGLSEFDPAFAVDGIDELLTGFLGRRAAERAAKPVLGIIALVAAGRPERWTCRVHDDDVSASVGLPAGAPADASVEADPADLYLMLWNRCSPRGLALGGRAELVDLWQERAQVTWG